MLDRLNNAIESELKIILSKRNPVMITEVVCGPCFLKEDMENVKVGVTYF